MATILLSAAGAALGAGFGGTVLGLSGAVIGRAIGATLGRVIDQRLLGKGSGPVEVGRVERFRVMGAGEGAAIPVVWGRVRVGGQVIWASRFQEEVTRVSGGKGVAKPKTLDYSYSVSLAVALCEGVIARVGRVWADGQEVEARSLDLRVYTGTEDQLPDPKIEAVEGAGHAPAYRGVAYVVIEDLDLGRFGNRVPQFSFEVIRPAQGLSGEISDLRSSVRAVAMMPGTGEYALATTRVHYADAPGVNRTANVNSPSGRTDFQTSLAQLVDEAPRVGAASLIVSWFGDDLRCGSCQVRPKVEQTLRDGVGQPWRAGGIGRAEAALVARDGGRVVYGGTPGDASVLEAIAALKAEGKAVMFYPFLLMEQLAGNDLPDPWTGVVGQPALPWRGRITLSVAPGRPGSPDRSAGAAAEVAAFFGTAAPGDFAVVAGRVVYSGPQEWSYRRFILHYAHLCAMAGGVDAFCVGSEMRGLTQVRGAGDSFPAVAALRQLVAEVRAILGPDVKISYAADWSEYFGYSSPEGNRYFHLDPFWADPEVGFVGIDNYMPLSDWRDGDAHADAVFGSIYNLGYLKANIEGGEGFAWYYQGAAAEALQVRTPITDQAYGEPWVWRYKDLRGWWDNAHHDRVDGVRAAVPTPWVPRSKPFWFTELGCAAIDKATNQPNVFLDPKSSESFVPKYSSGRRDDVIQMQYLRAMAEYWDENNVMSEVYGGPMVDMDHAFVWAWDARPFPEFPGNLDLWSDGANYSRGHWITGRITNQPLAAVVAEICERAGLRDHDVSGLHGVVRGYAQPETGSARAALQPLMLAHGFEAVERDGVVRFSMRDGRASVVIRPDELAVHPEAGGDLETARAPEAEMAGRVRVAFVEAEGDFETRSEEAVFPDDAALGVSQSDLALVLTRAEARAIAERWLAESRVARDGARFALPPSRLGVGAGDVVDLGAAGLYRIDRAEASGAQLLEAVRVEPAVYVPSDAAEERVSPRAFVAPVPVYPLFLDLPLLTGAEDPVAPHLAVTGVPWPGAVAVWESEVDDGYRLNRLMVAPATVGVTETALFRVQPGVWDRGPALRVRLSRGAFASAAELAVLAGANAVAIGDGSADRWEVFQFANAALVAPGVWELSLRLRGQGGTDGTMPDVWPAGAVVVALDRAVEQIVFAPANRGLARHYRIGTAARGYDDPAVVHRVEAFAGIGLRPYAPAHLRHRVEAAGDRFTWVRRTRVDGDSWESEEVPLGEVAERYRVRVVQGAAVLREVDVTTPEWLYPTALQTSDGVSGAWRLEVAQVSDRFGPGPFKGIDLDD